MSRKMNFPSSDMRLILSHICFDIGPNPSYILLKGKKDYGFVSARRMDERDQGLADCLLAETAKTLARRGLVGCRLSAL